MTPRHAIFRRIYEECLAVTPSVYDYAPGGDALLPFIHVANSSDNPGAVREMEGKIRTFIRLYGRRTERGLLDNWTVQLHGRLNGVKEAHGYSTHLSFFQAQDMELQSEEPTVGIVILLEFDYNN